MHRLFEAKSLKIPSFHLTERHVWASYTTSTLNCEITEAAEGLSLLYTHYHNAFLLSEISLATSHDVILWWAMSAAFTTTFPRGRLLWGSGRSAVRRENVALQSHGLAAGSCGGRGSLLVVSRRPQKCRSMLNRPRRADAARGNTEMSKKDFREGSTAAFPVTLYISDIYLMLSSFSALLSTLQHDTLDWGHWSLRGFQ